MRILLLNQFFWPDSAATGQLLTDLASAMADQGHDVTVICGPNGYVEVPAGSVPPPVDILRTPGLRFSRGIVSRILSYASFGLAAIWYSLRIPKPDLVLSMTTPPLLSLVGWMLQHLRGSKHFIWEMDLYPEVANDLNVLRSDSWLSRLIGKVSSSSRCNADGVIVLGECMRDRLLSAGVPRRKIRIAENWADGQTIYPSPYRTSAHLKVMYSGNLGMAHDIDTIAGAIGALSGDDRFRFTFVGGGARSKELQAKCEESQWSSVAFLPYQSRERLAESLCSGDIGLVTLNASCSGSVVPSKVYSLMAAGRPVLFIGPASATPARTIERFQCGWHVENGDVEGLTALLQVLAASPSLVRQAGERARAAFLQNFDLPVGVARLMDLLGLDSEPPYTVDLDDTAAKCKTEENPKWGSV
jgi:glycosyltransferase involved in cell wall biosynthesis